MSVKRRSFLVVLHAAKLERYIIGTGECKHFSRELERVMLLLYDIKRMKICVSFNG